MEITSELLPVSVVMLNDTMSCIIKNPSVSATSHVKAQYISSRTAFQAPKVTYCHVFGLDRPFCRSENTCKQNLNPSKSEPMPRPPNLGPPLSYELVQELTDDLPLNTLHQAGSRPKRGRQRLDIQSLRSVVLWLASHGSRSLREEIAWRAMEALVKDRPVTSGRSRKRRRPKA